ncbi:MAG: hypothetical protein MI866_11295 [Bacteroidales bacterium]|nr:hypothetical protein [Bacteroidales bacterium]
MKQILFLTILLGSQYACQKEPTFPDPGFDTTSDVNVTVRRDTIDHYYLKADMKVPNGIRTIEILNGQTYEVVEEISDYNGQKDINFEYKVDLTSITTRDTTLYYTVRVLDKDLRTFNKAFSIEVKRFSEPTVIFSGLSGGTLGVVSQVFELQALFETGLYNMKRYTVKFDGKTIDQGTFETDTAHYNYSIVCNEPMIKGVDYTLSITLEDIRKDEEDQIRTESIKVRLVDMKRPVKVFRYGYDRRTGVRSLHREMSFAYNIDKPHLLDSIYGYFVRGLITGASYTQFSKKFSYNENNMVTGIVSYSNYNEVGGWNYTYDENSRLTGVYGNKPGQWDIVIKDWYEDGRIKTFMRDPQHGITIEEAPYLKSISGEMLFAESWITSRVRGITTEMTPIPNPLYNEYLPPLIPEEPRPSGEIDIYLLLMKKYGPVSEHEFDESLGVNTDLYKAVRPDIIFTYGTDNEGNLIRFVMLTWSNFYQDYQEYAEYVFIYE